MHQVSPHTSPVLLLMFVLLVIDPSNARVVDAQSEAQLGTGGATWCVAAVITSGDKTSSGRTVRTNPRACTGCARRYRCRGYMSVHWAVLFSGLDTPKPIVVPEQVKLVVAGGGKALSGPCG